MSEARWSTLKCGHSQLTCPERLNFMIHASFAMACSQINQRVNIGIYLFVGSHAIA